MLCDWGIELSTLSISSQCPKNWATKASKYQMPSIKKKLAEEKIDIEIILGGLTML